MGRFQNLSQVGLVLADVIESAVAGGTEVLLNVPLENAASASPAVRISLIWTTPQPGHRNDLPEREPDGTMALPPPTLSAWYVITTYGMTDEENAIGAHDLLGQIIRAFHIQSTLELPIDGLGEGRIHVAQVPIDADLNEKIWGSLQVRHRPWVLFDVGPIQVLRTDAPGAVQPLVHPGGIRLGPVDVADRPRITRISPEAVGVGGRVRLDASYTGAPTRVTVGQTQIVPPNIAAMEVGGPVLVTLPGGVTEGAYDLTLGDAGSVSSEAVTLTVLEATRVFLNAPQVLRHPRANDLVLTGGNLGVGAADVMFWPDTGISVPTDVVTVAGTAAGADITIPAANLAPLRNTTYRISFQFSTHGFTPYVLLEITA
jgi:uncharacterized protein DUF4255